MRDPSRVLVFCAHSDDQVLGAGGYIAKLAKRGAQVKTIVCSFGEQSHPHLTARQIQPTRVLESKKADRILGGAGVMFLGLHEGSFEDEYRSRKIHKNIVRYIRAFGPERILTHSDDDPHPDHRATHRMLLQLRKEAAPQAEVYTFDIWNLVNVTKRKNPKLVIDITSTFSRKIDAIGAFRSQRPALALLLWSVYAKAVFWGFKRGCRYAEAYYKIR
jgi:LmbE family N-acetylglucosaminyl deacetylase